MNKFILIDYIATVVIVFKNLLFYAIIARIILSWLTMGQLALQGKVAQFLQNITDPIINLVRVIPHRIGMIDLAPMLALFGIDLLGKLIVTLLYNLL